MFFINAQIAPLQRVFQLLQIDILIKFFHFVFKTAAAGNLGEIFRQSQDVLFHVRNFFRIKHIHVGETSRQISIINKRNATCFVDGKIRRTSVADLCVERGRIGLGMLINRTDFLGVAIIVGQHNGIRKIVQNLKEKILLIEGNGDGFHIVHTASFVRILNGDGILFFLIAAGEKAHHKVNRIAHIFHFRNIFSHFLHRTHERVIVFNHADKSIHVVIAWILVAQLREQIDHRVAVVIVGRNQIDFIKMFSQRGFIGTGRAAAFVRNRLHFFFHRH